MKKDRTIKEMKKHGVAKSMAKEALDACADLGLSDKAAFKACVQAETNGTLTLAGKPERLSDYIMEGAEALYLTSL